MKIIKSKTIDDLIDYISEDSVKSFSIYEADKDRSYYLQFKKKAKNDKKYLGFKDKGKILSILNKFKEDFITDNIESIYMNFDIEKEIPFSYSYGRKDSSSIVKNLKELIKCYENRADANISIPKGLLDKNNTCKIEDILRLILN